jgi:hypothetical protein
MIRHTQHYRRRSVSGRHAIIIHRRQVQHQSSRGIFITLWMARLPLRHRPIVLRSPVNGSESAIGRGCIRATGRDVFLFKPLLRVPTCIMNTTKVQHLTLVYTLLIYIYTIYILYILYIHKYTYICIYSNFHLQSQELHHRPQRSGVTDI